LCCSGYVYETLLLDGFCSTSFEVTTGFVSIS